MILVLSLALFLAWRLHCYSHDEWKVFNEQADPKNKREL